MVAAVPTVKNDTLLTVNEDNGWQLKNVAGLEKVKQARSKCGLRDLQKKYLAKRQKILTSVAESFTFANKLLDCRDALLCMTERVTRVNRVEDLEG